MSGASDYLSLRISAALKNNFYNFCKNKGFTASKAVKMFIFHCVKNGVMPYDFAQSPSIIENNNLIRISIRVDSKLKQKFSDACGNYGLPMSIFVRDFMNECVTRDKFPFDMDMSGK